MEILTAIAIARLYLDIIWKLYNKNEHIYFRVVGGPEFGNNYSLENIFAHEKSWRLLGYLEWNGCRDLDLGGHGACGQVRIIFCEDAVMPLPQNKMGNHSIDEGEVFLIKGCILWQSPMLWMVENSIKSQVYPTWIDWKVLFQEK